MQKFALVAAFAAAISTLSFSVEARTRLTKAEVQNIFIGKKIASRLGTTHFRSDGTFTYTRRRINAKTRGPWRYRLAPDGSVRSKFSHYRFYRTKTGGYEIYSTRSGRYNPVRPQ